MTEVPVARENQPHARANASSSPGSSTHPTGLAVATLAIGVFALVAAVVAWLIWLAIMQGGFGYNAAPAAAGGRFRSFPPAATTWLQLAAAATWATMLPTAALGLVLARCTTVRNDARVRGTRAGTLACLSALLLALAGLGWLTGALTG